MDLTDSIRRYFFDNFDRLKPRRRFHFASRLAAWEGLQEATDKLGELKSFMVPLDHNRMFSHLLNQPLGLTYAQDRRRPYFQKYSSLHGLNLCLFQIRHLKEVYGIDLRDSFTRVVDIDDARDSACELLSDLEALRVLSSFAVNHLYLLDKLYGLEFDPAIFLKIADYDESDDTQLNLTIYMLTHCLIAESNFYSDLIPANRLKVYASMIDILDSLISKQTGIKIDVKLEYLVASRICHRVSPFQERICAQLSRHLSPAGYIIDVQGAPGINNLNTSEHRNVLFIMSQSAYSPHKIRID